MLRLLEGEESAPIYGQSPMGLECKQSPVRLGPQFKLYSCLFPKLRLCLESNVLVHYHSDCCVDIKHFLMKKYYSGMHRHLREVLALLQIQDVVSKSRYIKQFTT